MIFIWRGLGWTTPIILFGTFLGTELISEAIAGNDTYYQDHAWTKDFATLIGGALVALLGFYLNHVKRKLTFEGGTEADMPPSHTFFLIPLELFGAAWVVVFTVLFYVV